jgi:hypothetical protein
MQPGRGLTQHVRALETRKGLVCIAPLLCASSNVELGLDGGANTVMETGHDYSCEMGRTSERPAEILLGSPIDRLNKGADIETQLLHVACITSTVAAGDVDWTAAAGGCTDGCQATSAAAASTAIEATRPTRWIGVGLAFGHEVREGMKFSPGEVDEMLDLYLG